MRGGHQMVYYQVVGQGEPIIQNHGLSGSSRWWVRNYTIMWQKLTLKNHLKALIKPSVGILISGRNPPGYWLFANLIVVANSKIERGRYEEKLRIMLSLTIRHHYPLTIV
jgi:hypothetical protein